MAIEGFEEIVGSELIQDNFLFKNLNFTEAQDLARICHQVHYPKGAMIIEENALGAALYVVEKGEVSVVKGEGRDLKEIARLGRGQLFGEMSLVENELTSASVVAANEVDCLVIHRDEFESLLEKNQALALKVYKSFCKMLSERLRKTTSDLSGFQPKARLPKPESMKPRIAGPKPKPKNKKSR
jgi:CRP-like cAMP-binding protein